MNITTFNQQLAATLAFAQQLELQFANSDIPKLDKDILAARLRELYSVIIFDNDNNKTNIQTIKTINPTNEVIFDTVNKVNTVKITAPIDLEIVNTENKKHYNTSENLPTTIGELANHSGEHNISNENLPTTCEAENLIQENFTTTIEADNEVQENSPTTSDILLNTIEETNEVEEIFVEEPEIVQNVIEILPNPAENVATELVVVNSYIKTEEPKIENTALVINNGFSMVEQKNNALTVNNQAIYDANEEAMRNKSAFKSEYDDLFEFKAASELSQRLSETKIEDLNKAMGLNEKFFYINELFGGNSAKFRACTEFLNNNSKNIETAREYLEANIMDEFHWANAKRKVLAKDFIKIVRRRYLK